MALPPERQLCQTTLADICNQYKPWVSADSTKCASIIRRIERNCLAKTIDQCIENGVARSFTEQKFRSRYSANCARIMANLNIKGLVCSSYLLDGLLSGNIDPSSICDLTSAQLNPAANEAERAEIDIRKAVVASKKISLQHRCKKCGENKTSYLEAQTRAGDEASVISVKCENCQYVWRFG